MSGSAPLLANAYDDDQPITARKPLICEAISCDFFTGALCLFISMAMAEALAAVPYCMLSQHSPFYKGGDGFQECLLNYREVVPFRAPMTFFDFSSPTGLYLNTH